MQNVGNVTFSIGANPCHGLLCEFQQSLVHCYSYEYQWFLDISLQLSMQVWISTLISKQGYPCRDIHAKTFYNGCPWSINIHEWVTLFSWISVIIYPCFYWYPFGYPLISTNIDVWTCYGFSIQECSDGARTKSGTWLPAEFSMTGRFCVCYPDIVLKVRTKLA